MGARVCYLGVLVILGAISLLTCGKARAQSSELFSGKRIVMVIDENPGGGSDAIGRMFGQTLAKYLPGKPTIIFQNLSGGGGIKAFNYAYVQLPPDGFNLITGGTNAFDPVQLRNSSVKYDPMKFQYIVGFSNASSLLLIRTDSKAKLTSESGPKLSMAAIDSSRSSTQMAFWGGVALGWKFQLVIGYPGTAAMLLALQRGEVDMTANNFAPAINPIVENGNMSIIAQTGEFSNGTLTRSNQFSNVPLVNELVEAKLDGRSLNAFKLWEARSVIGKWYALPPKTPERYVTAYRKAVNSAVKDEQFQKWAVKTGGGEIKNMSAQELLGMIRDIVNTSDDTISYMDDLVMQYRR